MLTAKQGMRQSAALIEKQTNLTTTKTVSIIVVTEGAAASLLYRKENSHEKSSAFRRGRERERERETRDVHGMNEESGAKSFSLCQRQL